MKIQLEIKILGFSRNEQLTEIRQTRTDENRLYQIKTSSF